jgi:hypothetical protein
MRPLPLAARTQTDLTRIHAFGWTLSVFAMSPPARWLDFPPYCHILRPSGKRARRRQTSG